MRAPNVNEIDRGIPRLPAREISALYRRDPNIQIDPVEQRAGDPGEKCITHDNP